MVAFGMSERSCVPSITIQRPALRPGVDMRSKGHACGELAGPRGALPCHVAAAGNGAAVVVARDLVVVGVRAAGVVLRAICSD